MPAYNCEKYISKAIDSILNQTHLHFELLISDDCSADKTKSIIDSYADSRIKRFHNEQNLGYLKTTNELFKKCKGKYITFQDADDYSVLNRLEILLNEFKKDPELCCVGSNIIRVDENGIVLSQTNYPKRHKEIFNQFLSYKIVFTGAALMVRKKIIDEIGLYNEYFNRIGSEDTYWFSNIIQNFKVANVEYHLYHYRYNSNSVSLNHTDEKSRIGHEIIVKIMRRKLKGKEDFIQTKNTSEIKKYETFIKIVKEANSHKLKSLFKFFFQGLKNPKLSIEFIRPMLSKLRN
jgi:glycosyltransferase involved in cell wall biosynthesis